MKKLLAILLTFAMLCSLTVPTVWATEDAGTSEETSGETSGEGETETPGEGETETIPELTAVNGHFDIPDNVDTFTSTAETISGVEVTEWTVLRTAEDLKELNHIVVTATVDTTADAETQAQQQAEKDAQKAAQMARQYRRYILANDIDFEGADVMGVYNLTWNIIFDGNGYCFKNFKSSVDIGLFGGICGNTIVRNFSIGSSDAPIEATSTATGKTHGVLCAYINTQGTVTIQNVHVYANLNIAQSNTGLFIGFTKGGVNLVMENCTANGSITSSVTDGEFGVGGFIGNPRSDSTVTFKNCVNNTDIVAKGNAKNTKTGGFIGNCGLATLTVQNCTNNGNVSNESNLSGGFVGEFWASTKLVTTYKFVGCINNGDISASSNSVGGIFGQFNDATNGQTGGSAIFTDCGNYGKVKGTAQVSAMIGNLQTKTTAIKVQNFTNRGDLTVAGDAGILFGRLQNCTTVDIDKTINYGSISGSANMAVVCGSICAGTITVKNVLNFGNLESTGNRSALASGWNAATSLTVENCIDLGNHTAIGQAAGIVAHATANTTVKNCISAGTISGGTIGVIVGANDSAATYSGNYCLKPSNSANTTGVADDHILTDMTAVLNILNDSANGFTDVWGKFTWKGTSSDAKAKLTLATPELVGVQETAPADGKISVRFIATLQETLRYSKVGFKVKVTVGEQTAEQDVNCAKVYLNLTEMVDGTANTVSAGELGGAYVYALIVTDVPTTGTVTFEVTPYAVDDDTFDPQSTYTGNGYIITYTDGVLTSTTAK